MDESFSIVQLESSYCEDSDEFDRALEVKHFVFEDLLDTNEKLICKKADLSESFTLYKYFLVKESRSLFSKKEEKELGCCLSFSEGTPFLFEDFNFKVQSLDEFTLLTEAVEVSSGRSYFFELCNLCELPNVLSSEQKVYLTLYTKFFKLLPPLSRFDQLADENREVIELAGKGNERALEKLEREVGEKEAVRLLREVREHPENLFDTYVSFTGSEYKIIGLVTSRKVVSIGDKELLKLNVWAEETDFTILLPKNVKVSDGDRVEVVGLMKGKAVF